MNKNLHYPIKYAPFEIKKGCGHDAWGGSIEETFCYIASPCYIISERKIYRADGTHRMQYEVVFEKHIGIYNEIKEQFPENNCYGECINATVVDEVSTLEIMQNICLEKNHHKLASTLCYTPIRSAQIVSDKFFQEISEYDILLNGDKEIGGKQKKLV